MKPSDFRELKTDMVYTPDSVEDLMNHPLVEATPAGSVIIAMAMNTLLEQLARKLEDREEET